jgi:IS30 family transposase
MKTKRKTTERHAHKAKTLKFNDRMKQVPVKWLQVDKWGPELISVRGNETGLCPVSHECLYQWIWACKHGKKSDSHGILTSQVSIENTNFNRPYTSQDKGTVENRIGKFDVFFPERPTFVKYAIIVSDKLKNSLTTDL